MQKPCAKPLAFILLCLLAAPMFFSSSPRAIGDVIPPDEQKLIDDLLELCNKFGKWCAEMGFVEEGKTVLKMAERISLNSPLVTELEEKLLADPEGEPDAAVKKEFETKRASYIKRFSDTCIKLYKKKVKLAADRHRDYLLWALETDKEDKTAWKLAAEEIKQLVADKMSDILAKYVPCVLTIPSVPDSLRKPVIDAELKNLTTATVQRKAVKHEMWYELSLPPDWTIDKSWPVLFGFEGAGCNFAGYHKGFVNARSRLPLIVVTLHTFSSTNELDPKKYRYDPKVIEANNNSRLAFDSAGFDAVLADLKVAYNAQEKVVATGFSGGGNMTYFLTLYRTGQLLASFPACANFNPGMAQNLDPVAESLRGLYIHIFTGEKDPHRDLTHGKFRPGIEEQTDWAVKALADAGFTSVKRTMLPGVGHAACAKQVMEELIALDIIKPDKRN